MSLTLIIASISHFLVDLMIGIWPLYKTLAKIDLAIAGLIGTICVLAGEGMQIVFGSLSDRGYRRSVLLSGLFLTIASAWFVYTDHLFIIFILYFLTCIGSGAFHPSAASLVANLQSKRKNLLVGIFTCGGALGMALSQLIFIYTQSHLQGHSGWLTIPTLILVGLIVLSPFGKSASIPSSSHFDFKALLSFFRQRELRMLYFSQICTATMLWGTMFLLPDFLSSRNYEPWITLGFGHFMFILGSAFMMIPAGLLADRFTSRKVIIFAILTSMILFYLLLYLPLLNDTLTLFLLFAIGASLGVTNPVAIAMGTRLAPNHKGMVSAFLMGLVWCVSESIALAGGGILATCFNEDAPAKALAILGCLFLFGFVAALKLPKKEEALISLSYEFQG